MTTTTTTTIDKLNSEIIQLAEQIETAQTATMKELLAQLRDSKIREIELLQRLATKSSTSGKLSTAESVLKSIFVACRPQVLSNAPEDYAITAFRAAVAALNIDFTAELQGKIFATSTVHCLKSNFNKKTNNIGESYDSYLETVRQAKLLLPKVTDETWNAWLKSVQEAATRAAKKRNIVWTVPTVQPETVQPETVQPETVQPETVQPETVQPETVQPETVQPDKKTIITTRKQGKRK